MEGGAARKQKTSKPSKPSKSKSTKKPIKPAKSTYKKPMSHYKSTVHKRSSSGMHNLLPSELREKTVVELRHIARENGVPQSHNGKSYDKSELVKVISKH